jgi:hypothetical protein
MSDDDWKVVGPNLGELSSAQKLSFAYLKSRATFKVKADKNPFLLGNDNFIGRIAEMLVIDHFLQDPNVNSVHRSTNQSHKGYDLVLNHGISGERLISVKCITWENQSKRSSRVRYPGDNLEENAHNNPPPENFEVWCVHIDKNCSPSISRVPNEAWIKRKSRYFTLGDLN